MRVIFNKTKLFTTLFMLTSLMLVTAAEKKYQSRPVNPFGQKIQKHQNKATIVNRNAFKQEARVLAARIASVKSGARLNKVPVSPQLQALENLQEFTQQNVRVYWDEKIQTPIFIHGNRLNKAKRTGPALNTESAAQKNAEAFLVENAALLQIVNPAEEFQLIDVWHDNYGM